MRPHITLVLAISADGKISHDSSAPARFASPADKIHLEQQIAQADGTLFGAATLRAYGTTLGVSNPELVRSRQKLGQPPQPVQIVCSQSGQINPQLRFFSQPLPRWLLTTAAGAENWGKPEFERIVVAKTNPSGIDWIDACQQLAQLGLQRLAVLGGGEVVASLLEIKAVDELFLTLCPLIIGGKTAPGLAGGKGFLIDLAPRLEILSVQTVEQEIFLHYRLGYAEALQ